MKYLFVKGLGLFFLGLFVACSSQNGKTEQQNPKPKETKVHKQVNYTHFSYPANDRLYQLGDTVELKWKNEKLPDSIHIFIDGKYATNISGAENHFVLHTQSLRVGTLRIRLVSYFAEGTESDDRRIRLASDIVAQKMTCQVLETYPHDPKAYTQGLFVHEGLLYEGTGQYGESSLRKVDLKSGEIIESLSLPDKYFGEGIAAYQDKIIQLTWRSQMGFVYDRLSFQLIQKVQYPTDGWGITYDGKRLIMSDGSATVYFLDPDYFGELSRQEIWDGDSPVKMLNELEYVDGLIYANVWQTADIVVFEPNTGRVVQRIDCSKLVPPEYHADRDNVLNGIAYQPETKTFLLTGKRWAHMYKVKFKPAS